MRLVVQNAAKPEQIIRALESIVGAELREVRIAVAYVTESGRSLLCNTIREKIGASAWRRAQKDLVSCVDYGITDPVALERWADLPNSGVLVQNVGLLETDALIPAQAFHPKYYEFRGENETNIAVGSANLTERALTCNTEAITVHTHRTNTANFDRVWRGIAADAVTIDERILARYRALRRAAPPPRLPAVPLPTCRPSTTLWEALQANKLVPSAYDSFWVTAGSMRSGGSRSQLELPRGANRYFGFDFDDYAAQSAEIGVPALVLGRNTYVDRPLRWHAHNGMERLNLPTGHDYANSVVLFVRRDDGYAIYYGPRDSNRCRAWMAAADAIGRRYRLGGNSPRECGLF